MLTLEMFMRHVDKTNLSDEKKELFKKAFYKVMEQKIDSWLENNKSFVEKIKNE